VQNEAGSLRARCSNVERDRAIEELSVAEDLGTWSPEQATVLLEVLARAGLSPKARRTRRGVVVTVEDHEADRAHQTLLEHMDTIANAARPPKAPARPTQRARGQSDSTMRPLPTQRLQTLARPLGILLIALLIAAIIPPLRLVVSRVCGRRDDLCPRQTTGKPRRLIASTCRDTQRTLKECQLAFEQPSGQLFLRREVCDARKWDEFVVPARQQQRL
jgi:hypothetical protein